MLGVRARLDESPRRLTTRADSDAFRDAQGLGGGRERRDVPPRRRPAPGRARVSGGEVRDPPRREAGERASRLPDSVGDRAGGLRQRVLRERAEETRDGRAVAPLPRAGGSAGRRLRRADRRVEPRVRLGGAARGDARVPGRDEADQLARIAEVIGPPPERVLRRGDEKKRRAWAEALERTRRQKTTEAIVAGATIVPGSSSGRRSPGRVRCATRWTGATTATSWTSSASVSPGARTSASRRAARYCTRGPGGWASARVAHPARTRARGARLAIPRAAKATLSRPFSSRPRATSAIRARLSGGTRSSVPSRRSYRWRRRKSRSRR